MQQNKNTNSFMQAQFRSFDMSEIDVLIAGSGLGGLVCGAVLSKEGLKVCILEKNRQTGGCLQTFVRDKTIFDSGVHYIGGLEPGQNLYQIFSYLGIMDKLKLERMDEVFDKIVFDDDEIEYGFAQGYETFIATLAKHFPNDVPAIQKYCDDIRDICQNFPMYNLLHIEDGSKKMASMSINAKEHIESLTDNVRLQEVLAGNNLLYAGVADKSPLFVHALVLNSYIESSWKCLDGGSQIGKYLIKTIRDNGGEIIRNCEVMQFVEVDGKIDHITLKDGSKLYAKSFISNIHPSKTLDMLESSTIRPAFKKRIQSLENTISSFSLHIVLKKDSFKYFRSNYYYHEKDDVWNGIHYKEDEWPMGYGLFLSASSKNQEYADALMLLTYMRYDDVADWADTFNTVSQTNDRGEDYEAFKKRKAEKLLDIAEKKFPGLRNCIQTYYTSTPLSYRDYIGSYDGSMYGIMKDHSDAMRTMVSPRTRIPNLFMTGQNLMLHGILGVSVSALLTCGEFINIKELLEKIRNA